MSGKIIGQFFLGILVSLGPIALSFLAAVWLLGHVGREYKQLAVTAPWLVLGVLFFWPALRGARGNPGRLTGLIVGLALHLLLTAMCASLSSLGF